MLSSISGIGTLGERRTCLVYHINKGLRVVPEEVAGGFTLILVQEDRLDQGGEFKRSERPSDQTPTGWSVESRSNQYSLQGRREGRKAYRLQQWCGDQRVLRMGRICPPCGFRGGVSSVC